MPLPLAAMAGRLAMSGAAKMGAGKVGQRAAGSVASSATTKALSSGESRSNAFHSQTGLTIEPPTAPTSYIG